MTRLVLPATLLLTGCLWGHSAPAPAPPPRGPTLDSLLHLDASRADSTRARGAVNGSVGLFAADVAYLRAGVPAVYGRDAARAVLAGSPSNETAWLPLGGGVSRDLRSGYTYGVAGRASGRASGGANDGADSLALERYIAYWQRAAGAPWRIVGYAEMGGPSSAEVPRGGAVLTPPADRGAPAAMRAAGAIRQTDSLFADAADRLGTPYAFSHYAAPLGVLFGAPQLVVGPDAMLAYFTRTSAEQSLAWRPVYARAAGSLDLGFTVGESVVTERGPSGAAVQRFGKYLTVWERQPGGAWRFVADGGNATPQPR